MVIKLGVGMHWEGGGRDPDVLGAEREVRLSVPILKKRKESFIAATVQ